MITINGVELTKHEIEVIYLALLGHSRKLATGGLTFIETACDLMDRIESDLTSDNIVIGVDNVRTAEESQAYLKTLPAFKHLFDPI